ncbi:MAG: hypothetical protein AB1611_05840 [bacterium]
MSLTCITPKSADALYFPPPCPAASYPCVPWLSGAVFPAAPCWFDPFWGAGSWPVPSLSAYPLPFSFLPFLSAIPQSLILPGILEMGLLADITRLFPPPKQAAVVTATGLPKASLPGTIASTMTVVPTATAVPTTLSPVTATLPTVATTLVAPVVPIVPAPVIPLPVVPAVTPAGLSITTLLPAPVPAAPISVAPVLPAAPVLTPVPIPVSLPTPTALTTPSIVSAPLTPLPVIPAATASIISLISGLLI